MTVLLVLPTELFRYPSKIAQSIHIVENIVGEAVTVHYENPPYSKNSIKIPSKDHAYGMIIANQFAEKLNLELQFKSWSQTHWQRWDSSEYGQCKDCPYFLNYGTGFYCKQSSCRRLIVISGCYVQYIVIHLPVLKDLLKKA